MGSTLELSQGAGPKRHRVVLQSLTETADAYGQLVKAWADGPSYWASIEQRRGAVRADADQQKPQRFGVLTLRYFGPLDQTVRRFRFGTRILNIVSVEDVGERHREYRISYQEVLGVTAG